MRNKQSLLREQAAEYARLGKQLNNLPLLAKGSVFKVDPPEEAPRARTRYIWTRKVKGKTVTRGLDREQYLQMREAIKANHKVETVLARMREIAQNHVVSKVGDNRKTRKSKPSITGLI